MAQPTPDQAVQAKQLFEDGRKLAKEAKWAAACEDFTKSFALDPAIGTELNLGDCEEHEGHLAIAWHLFDDAAKKDTEADRVKYARGRADGLTPKLSTAIVRLPDASTVGLVLKVGGQLVPPAPEIRSMVDPGTVKVELDVPGRQPETRTQPAKPGETVTFDFTAPPTVVTPPPPTHTDEPVTGTTTTVSEQHRQHSRVVLAGAVAAGGGALIITSGVMALVAKSHYDAEIGVGKDCDPQLHCNLNGTRKVNDAIHLANIATIPGVVGLAAVIAGGVLYMTAPKEFVVAPAVSGQGGGITLSGTF